MWRRSSAGSRSRTERPSSRMSPPVGSIMRVARRMAVVLPEPDGPTSTQILPAGTSNESSLIAGSAAPGYVLETRTYSSVAACEYADDPSGWAVVVGDMGEAASGDRGGGDASG